MDVNDHRFKIGDEVITIDGEKGKITDICECKWCKKRGFYEPVWVEDETGDERFISHTQAYSGFPFYYKIGERYFGKFDMNGVQEQIAYHEEHLARYKKALGVIIEETEKRLQMAKETGDGQESV